ncbi:SOS response-associated peptidase [Roseiterribacter gracilis]|uniref:Abasic site processing protein n=1 Tax=Roseiterribacter gracilis TaxID=2812848 RepID=A0A8S8XHG3_9PROT|nr:DUF159 family protein [Rhodospirillales bacterium TMPK1]
MCNRVRRTYTVHEVIDLVGARFAPRTINFDALRATNLEPRWNVAPKSIVPVLRELDGELRFDMLHWDMCPTMPWWTKQRVGETAEQAAKRRKPLMTNAVIEKVKTTGAATFKKRRCLIPVSGFWEWTGEKGDKQGWAIEHCDGTPIMFAGVWDSGRHEGVDRDSVAIITMPASPWMSAIHDRQPAMLPPTAWPSYIDTVPDDLAAMTETVDDARFRAFKVSKRVNSVRNDGPECLVPIAA